MPGSTVTLYRVPYILNLKSLLKYLFDYFISNQGSKFFSIQSRYPATLVNTPGSPKAHVPVAKLTTPIRYHGSDENSRCTKGPPESPLQLSMPKNVPSLKLFFTEKTSSNTFLNY